MRNKNSGCYQEHRDTIRPEKSGVEPAEENEYGHRLIIGTRSELVKVRITFTSHLAAPDIAICLM